VTNELAKYIDHTLLKPDGSEAQVRQLCKEAAQFRFATVCVNPTWVRLCSQILKGAASVSARWRDSRWVPRRQT